MDELDKRLISELRVMVALPFLNWHNCLALLAPRPKNAWIG